MPPSVAAALFPVLQRRQWNAVGGGEPVLRHAQAAADRPHVGNLNARHAQASHLATVRMRRRLAKAGDQLFCKLAHDIEPFSLAFQNADQLAHRALLVRRQIVLPRLGVDHQQVERPVRIVIEIDHARAAALTASRPAARTPFRARRNW